MHDLCRTCAGAGYALHAQTCGVACSLCLLLLEPLFVFSTNAGESPGLCVVKVPGSAASAVAGGGYCPASEL